MKIRLLIAAGICTLSASMSAQMLAPQPEVKRISPDMIQQVTSTIRDAGDIDNPVASSPAKAPNRIVMGGGGGNSSNDGLVAWYDRPAGTFYLTFANDLDGSMQTAPYLQIKPYAKHDFHANWTSALGDKPTVHWKMQGYNNGTGHREWLDWDGIVDGVQTYLFPVSWSIFETDSVPEVDITGNGNTVHYELGGYTKVGRYIRSQIVVYPHNDAYWLIAKEQMQANFPHTRLNATSKYFGEMDRQGHQRGLVMPTLSDGYYVFGKNTTNWNIMAVAYERPANYYAIRSVGVTYGYLKMSHGSAQIWAKVYRLNNIPAQDKVNCARITPADITLVAEGSTTINTSTPEFGFLEIPLYMKDPQTGLQYQQNIHVDYPVLVVVGGYDASNIKYFTMFSSADTHDEGFGELGYIGQYRNGEVRGFYGLTGFDTSGLEVGYTNTAPSISLDIETPHMQNFDYIRSHHFEAGGGTFTTMYSAYRGSTEWKVTTPEGDPLPQWIRLTYVDDYDQNKYYPSYNVTVNFSVTALPTGTKGRRQTVRFMYPGAVADFEILQGNVDGVNVPGDVNDDGYANVTDVNLIVSEILAQGNNTKYDLNGDGQVNVTDINLLVSIILKNS